jgi:ribosomal RNA-processing protein 36
LELAERYKELKKSGKVDKFLAKKRKKNLGKANKHLIKNNTVD